MKKGKRIFAVLMSLLLLVTAVIPAAPTASAADSASQIYYNIDFSAQVLKSRINQQVSQDCPVVAMATIEAYLYGATSSADRTTVYNALVSKNGAKVGANWSNCGYVYHSSINWDTVYDQLACGYPVIVHRPATAKKKQHWAVVAGYKGSATTLEKDKFVIVDVYLGTGGTDIYTSAAWATGTSIDKMVTRKNGIVLTSLSGIRMAINAPAVVHPYGVGHGVYGYITANENLTSVQLMVTNLSTGSNVFNKTVTPNAKSYLLFDLDSQVTFKSWPEGEYYYTVIAKTASGINHIQKYFTIDKTWPTAMPTRKLSFSFDLKGGTGTFGTLTVNHGSTLKMPTTTPTRLGYTFQGWNVLRGKDGTVYCTDGNWRTPESIQASGYTPYVYNAGNSYSLSYMWLKGCFTNTEYTFYPIWKSAMPSLSYTVKYDANGGSGTPADQSMVIGMALTLSSETPARSGYRFLGWATSATATAAKYQPGDSISLNGDTTLYAVWEKQQTSASQVVVTGGAAAPGGTVTVDISLVNNPGIAYLALTPVYDTSVMTLTAVENGSIIKDMDQGTNLTWSVDADTAANGTMARLTFKVNDNAHEGTYKVTVILREAYTLMGDEVAFTVADGSITVSDQIYGDATGDGIVNGRDVLLLRRYMANYNYDTGSSSVAAYPGADANGDGVINGRDVLLLRRYMANYNYDTGTSSVVLGPN